jgi:hypothetical protein
MLGDNVEVITAQTEDNITGIVIDGEPCLYWLKVYQAIGLRKEHAPKVIARLTEGIHYRKFSRTDYYQLFEGVAKMATGNNSARSFVFLTTEGYNRAIMEISTGHMSDPEIAAAIDRKKDEIANIYTRYQRGEVLQLPDAKQNTITGKVDQVLDENLDIAQSHIRKGADKTKAYEKALNASIEATGSPYLEYYRDIVLTLPAPSDIPLIEDIESGWYSASSIAKALNKKRNDVYNILISWGYMEMENGKHSITPEGKCHGKMQDTKFYGPKGSGIRQNWYWDQNTYDRIEHEFDIRKGQMTLTGEKACGVSA